MSKSLRKTISLFLVIALVASFVTALPASALTGTDEMFGLHTGGAAHPNTPAKSAQAVYTSTAPEFGTNDELWNKAASFNVNQLVYDFGTSVPASGVARVLWDDNNLYVRVEVADDNVFGGTATPRQLDSVEVMVSERNYRGFLTPGGDTNAGRVHTLKNANWYRLSAPAESGTGQYGRTLAKYASTPWTSSAANSTADSNFARSTRTENGYVTEFRIPFRDNAVAKKDGTVFGFELQINDVASASSNIQSRRIVTWNNTANDNDNITNNWGTLELTGWAAANASVAKFTAQENGSRGWKTTSAINLYFSADVVGLTEDDITLGGMEVTKGSLTSINSREYLLPISDVTAPASNVAADAASREVTITIDRAGVSTDTVSALVFYEMNTPPVGFEYFVSVYDPNFSTRMPSEDGLNDPFQFFVTTDGVSGGFGEVIPNRVVTEKDWENRRKEIQALAQYYFYGTTGTFAAGKDIKDIITNVTVSDAANPRVTVEMADNGRTHTANFTITMPTDANIEAAGFDPNNLPWGVGSNQTAYGIASVSVPSGYTTLYPADARVTGSDAGSIMQYAWHVGVIPAALEWLADNETPTKLNPLGGFTTGVSIGGKQARMAAMMNDRIAISAASESGSFGINPIRYLQEGRLYNYAGVREVNHFRYQKTYNSQYYSGEWGWMGLNTSRAFSEYNKELLPFDMHLLTTLMAPVGEQKRAFIEFLNDATSNGWATAGPGVLNYSAAKEVFDFLGSDNIAIRVRDGSHALQNRDLPYIVAVVDALFGPESENITVRSSFNGSANGMQNTLPNENYKTINDLTAYPMNIDSYYIQWTRPANQTSEIPGKDLLWVDVQTVTEGMSASFNAYTDTDVTSVSVKIYDHGDVNPTAPSTMLYDLGTFPVVNGKAAINLTEKQTKAGRYVITTIGNNGKEKRSVSFDGIDILTALRHGYNTQQSHTTNAYGFTSKINQSTIRFFYNDLELPLSTMEQETANEPSAFVMEYGISHPFGSGSQRVRMENLQLEAMPGYTFMLSISNPTSTPSWRPSEAVQRNTSYANWPPFANSNTVNGNGGDNIGENRSDGTSPIIRETTTTNFNAEVRAFYDQEAKVLRATFSEPMDRDNFGIGFEYFDDFSIEWANDNMSIEVTFNNTIPSGTFGLYIMRLKDLNGNMIAAPIKKTFSTTTKELVEPVLSSEGMSIGGNIDATHGTTFPSTILLEGSNTPKSITVTYNADTGLLEFEGGFDPSSLKSGEILTISGLQVEGSPYIYNYAIGGNK